MALKYKTPCPTCFAKTGYSIVTEEIKKKVGNEVIIIFRCPSCHQTYVKNKETGYLEVTNEEI